MKFQDPENFSPPIDLFDNDIVGDYLEVLWISAEVMLLWDSYRVFMDLNPTLTV